jgi:hypothetical protein
LGLSVKSTRTYLVCVLGVGVLALGTVAWRQYQELIRLRADTLDATERASLQKRLKEAQDRARDLEAQLASATGVTVVDGTADPATPGAPANGGGRGARGGRGNMTPAQQAAIQAIMQSPQVQALQKAALDARYAALIRNLNLSPEQGEKLKSLIADGQAARQDAMAAARAAGIDPRTDRQGFEKLVADAQAQSDSAIKAAIGDDGFAALQQYNQTMPQRNLVNQLQQQLSYSAPLSNQQAEQLVQLLATNTGQRGGAGQGQGFGGGGRGGFGGGGFGGGGFGGVGALMGGGAGGGGFGGAQITTATITQAQTFLAPAQVQALQQMQQSQQAQQQVQRQIQQVTRGNQNGAGGARGGRRGAATAQ